MQATILMTLVLAMFSSLPAANAAPVSPVSVGTGYNFTHLYYGQPSTNCDGRVVATQTEVFECHIGKGSLLGMVERLACDAEGNVLSQRWGWEKDGATIADCEQDKIQNKTSTLYWRANSNGVCEDIGGPGEPPQRYKTVWTCPPDTCTPGLKKLCGEAKKEGPPQCLGCISKNYRSLQGDPYDCGQEQLATYCT